MPQTTPPDPARSIFPGGFVRAWNFTESAVLVAALAGMVLLPLIEMVLRQFKLGISGSTAFGQHGSLIVAMVGGAVAARQGRLLSLATTEMLPKGWPTRCARIVAGSVAAVVTLALLWAGVEFVRSEFDPSRMLAYRIPLWVMQAFLPVGFGLIALRVLWLSGDRGWLRGIALTLTAVLLAVGYFATNPAVWVIPAFVALGIGTLLGSPIFAVLGGSAVILFWGELTPISSVHVDFYRLVTNPTLPAIPLFTLAGYFLAEGGASKRLIAVFDALFGSIRGGPAIVCVLVCAFFTSFTGASGVTILALGGLLMPVLVSAGYSPRNALGLLTGSGSLGLLFPPCLPLILYAIIAKIPIEQIFLAAILPGCVMVTATAMLGVWQGPPRRLSQASHPFSWRAARVALWAAKWELLLPAVCMVSLFSGWATTVEASAVTAIYALATQTILKRDLRLVRDVPRVMVEAGLVVGGVMLILCVAQGLTNYLIFAMVPEYAVEWVTGSVQNKLVFLLLLNLFLLLVGCLMDIYSAIVVVAPLLVPLGEAFEIDPLHLGVIFLANLELGYLTPPVGMNLFLSSYRFNKPLGEVCRSIVPVLCVQLMGVLLVTYLPVLTTWLPGLFR